MLSGTKHAKVAKYATATTASALDIAKACQVPLADVLPLVTRLRSGRGRVG